MKRFELKDPTPIAKFFNQEDWNFNYIDGSFYWFNEVVHIKVSNDEMYKWCNDFLVDLYDRGNLDKPPKSKDVEELIKSLKALKFYKNTDEPSWLEMNFKVKPKDLIILKNGFYNTKTKEMSSIDPNLFFTKISPFDYQPEMGMPKFFLSLLGQYWPDDQQSIDTLQEIFGLCLTYKTEFQKAFMLVGPKRSGKTTITKVLQELIGEGDYASPNFNLLGDQFGLDNLINKKIAFVNDARTSPKLDNSVIETILKITGEDAFSIPRKYRSDWNGRLYTRILVSTNEVPLLSDTSSVVASRFIILRMSESFYGKEDIYLFDKIKKEMPQILNWSIDGLERLLKRGFFIQPDTGAELVRQMHDIGSPTQSFVSECCELDPGYKIPTGELYNAFNVWAAKSFIANTSSIQIFGRNLYSVTHKVKLQQLTYNGRKQRFYVGIRLKPDFSQKECNA